MFTVEIDGLDELERDWDDAVGELAKGINRGVERGVVEGAAYARANHAYRDHTGALTRSIRGRLERGAVAAAGGEAIGVIEATAKYASFVELGTAPHDIYPKEGETFVGPLPKGQSRRSAKDIGTHRVALRWTEGGQTHFARRVHHPGTEPRAVIAAGVHKAERVIEAEVGLAEQRAAEIMNQG